MGRSLAFCIKRASDENLSIYSDRDWSKAHEEYETEAIFEENFAIEEGIFDDSGVAKYKVTGHNDDGEIHINVILKYDPFTTEFDYFTGASACHDGTLLFIQELFNKIVDRVVCCETYNKNIGEPKDGDTVRYTFGDFVYLDEYGEQFATDEKPWLQQRTTVLLPLKMEIV